MNTKIIYSERNGLKLAALALVLALSLSSVGGVQPALASSANSPAMGAPIGPPANVAATDGASETGVTITWTANGNDSYEVTRCDDVLCTLGPVTVGSTTGTSIEDTTGAVGQIYYYFVQGCDPGCRGGKNSDTGYKAIPVPANLTATDDSYSDVFLAWDAGAGATFYEVYRDTAEGGPKTLLDSPVSNSFTDTTAAAGTTYYYWVKACNTSVCSDYSLSDTGIQLVSFIFADGFESGDFSAWSLKQGLGLKVNALSALEGSMGMRVGLKNKKPKYVQDDTPTSESRYRARFLINLKGLKLQNKKSFILMKGQGAAGPAFLVRVRKNGLKFYIRAQVKLDSGKVQAMPWVEIPKKATLVEIDWAASETGLSNGKIDLYLDEVLKGSVADAANETLVVDSVRFGMVKFSRKFTIGGNFKLDYFESSRFFYVGP